jgi:hypothetical protein
MPRLRRSLDRRRDTQEFAAGVAAEALGQSETTGPKVEVGLLVFDDGKPPRYPAVGLHPGAIDGTMPHRCRLVTRG